MGSLNCFQPFLEGTLRFLLCINIAWHLQVITWANNVDKCSFILERTLIQMFIHTRENPYTNVSTP